ncbi:MAG: hypothetical protein ABT24_12110, partial [Thiomonas sp. SCN 64-16]
RDFDTGNQFHLTYRPADKVLATTLSLSVKDPEQAVNATESTQRNLKTVEIEAPAHWASALINRDESGLQKEEVAHVKAWVAEQGIGWPVSSSETFIGRHDGLLTEMATYSFLVHEKDLALRREDALLARQPHEMTLAEFATGATAMKLGAHAAREWAVFNGSAQRGELMGYAEGPTAEDALRMMHKNRVNNALYDNMPEAVRPPGMEPKSMPPQRVLDEYPDLQKKFAQAIKEHRQMLDKEDRKAAEYRDMTADQAIARIEETGRLTGKLTRIEPTPDPQRDLIHVQRAGVDVAITVPAGKVSHDLVAGTPIKLRYEPKAGLQVEADPQPSRNKAMER